MKKERTIVLFTQNGSVYDELYCDTYPIERNALTCKSSRPAIYHPPCRTWGRLRQFTHFHPGEHLLAVWSIIRIWRYGGVLEHPAGSKLWSLMGLSMPGSKADINGGISLSVNQSWFGHKCEKNTWVYIKGLSINEVPSFPLSFDLIEYSISHTKKNSKLKEVTRKYRNSTPVKFAEWLIDIVALIEQKSQNE